MNLDIRNSLLPVLALLLCCFWSGCASAPLKDWDSRVGTFTLADALKELGPPSENTKQPDGSKSVSWMTQRDERRTTLGIGTGISSAGSAAGIAQPMAPQPHDQYLELSFDKDGKLTAWKRVTR